MVPEGWEWGLEAQQSALGKSMTGFRFAKLL
jgi:hypothetical protein